MNIPKAITDHADVIQCVDRQQWLQERSKSIGASDAPVMLGLSSYGSNVSLWADKVRPPAFSVSTESQQIKLAMEAPILDLYGQRYGGQVQQWPQTWLARSKAQPQLHATPDGLALDPAQDGWGCLQVKAWSEFDRKSWENEPPLYVQVQLQQELAVTGLAWGAVVVMFGTQALERFVLPRNERFIASLIRAAEEFWAYVESQTEPPLDGSAHTRRALERLHPDDNGLAVMFPDDADKLLVRRGKLQQLIKRLGDAKDGIDNQLRAWLGEHTYGVTPGGQACSWKKQQRAEHIVKASEFRVLRLCKPPKNPHWSDAVIDYQTTKRKSIPRHVKRRMWEDCDRCCWCGRQLKFKDATIEHNAPLSKGGTNDDSNLALACAGCNSTRGDDATLPAEILA